MQKPESRVGQGVSVFFPTGGGASAPSKYEAGGLARFKSGMLDAMIMTAPGPWNRR